MAIKVQSGRLTAIAGLTNNVTVEAYDDTKAFLIVQGRGTDTTDADARYWQVRAITVDSTTLNFQVLENNGECTWWLVEATAGEFTVQRINSSFTASEAIDNHTVTAVDLAKTIVVGSQRLGGTLAVPPGNWMDATGPSYTTGYMTTTTNLQIARLAVYSSTQVNYTYYVVEFAAGFDVTVEAVQLGDAFSGTMESLPVAGDYSDDDTWLYATQTHLASSPSNCSLVMTMDFTTDDVDYARESGVVLATTSGVGINLMKFGAASGVVVAQGTGTLASGSATGTVTLNRAVRADRSVIYAMAAGSDETVGGAFPGHLVTVEFTSIDGTGHTTEVTVDRDHTGMDLDLSLFVADFDGTFPKSGGWFDPMWRY